MGNNDQQANAAVLTPRELLEGSGEQPRKLNQWLATAICGNDITSSCLYVAAIATVYSGALAPIVLLLVGGVLYLYRKIYTEVVEALPLNGGAYNCLLNCTSKLSASLAACMTILSYIATAVISSKTAVEYLHGIVPSMHVMEGTIMVLAIFAVLTIIGITESAVVALIIFTCHMTTLIAFCVLGAMHIPDGFQIFRTNWGHVPGGKQLATSLFLGFSSALLGVSGFESSANFVEEQQPGVFRKTLRNMWIAVIVFNPLTAVIALNLLPVDAIVSHKDNLLSHVAFLTGGELFQRIVVVDAVLVLSGAVLTSYVGVCGLVRRMALDQCFPGLLLKQNRRGTSHRIILAFFLLCSSILLLTRGNLLALAGVYTISFLGVMTLFGWGNILLKLRRSQLKRTYRAGWSTIFLGVAATSLGIVGNLFIDVRNFLYFLYYFIPSVLLVVAMYLRVPILRSFYLLADKALNQVVAWRSSLLKRMEAIIHQRVMLFARGGELSRLHQAFSYIMKNESSRHVILVHLYGNPAHNEEAAIRETLTILKRIFPDIEVELIVREGTYGPAMIDQLSQEFQVPKNNIFVGAPEQKHSFSVQDLGGVRVIF
ncbi:Amino acid transporter [Desulfacinum hydrothermale DSM 13146]|uniref:Amino acid transporter n=1 Tax=Desulfacinum hydrothermale DSM 13146 TaxID=1121390 RepID=A0A1W1XV78_9BACT|nr:APC family permease [Desulfacinum hydrothermale]SMC27806.1 Amino acid transporter [Desulfacinum hydrothermale DSM 13146]